MLAQAMSDCAAQAIEIAGDATKGEPGSRVSGLIGTTLDGAYRITRLIAEGGMSAVYEGVQLRLNQRVAVKVMARELALNQEALARFRREAEVTSRLRHPHLVTVTDFGMAPDGQPYLVMEHLEGIDLEHRIHQMGRLPLDMVVHITRQVAAALAAAHDQGIVHRDLKPANVFLVELPGEPDFAKILDFGISKVRAATTQLTKASAVIGTPNYMSPEQATGMLDEIDPRTDQWALACIVWEMLSGRPPFASDDMSAVFYQVIHLDPQPLRNRAPDLPSSVEVVLRRALSKTMADRFPSIKDFSNALAIAASARPADAVPSSRRAPDSSGANATGMAGPWVERRRSRQERRRANSEDPTAPCAVAGGDDGPRVGLRPGFWQSVKPIHGVAVLALALAIALLVPLRRSQIAEAGALPVVGAAGIATSAKAPPPVASAPRAPTPPTPTPATSTASASTSKKVPADPVPTLPRRPVKSHPAKAARSIDDSIDPFAPRRPSSLQKHGRKADADFVDPFGP
jgi:serine/threonine protein kinase